MESKQRRAPRVNKLFLAAYVNREGEEQKTPVLLGKTFNISSVGLGMEVYQEIAPGSIMEMEIDLLDSLLEVKGRVVHVNRVEDDRYLIGVEFGVPQEQLAGFTP